MKKLMIVALTLVGASQVSFAGLRGLYNFEQDEVGEKITVLNKTDGPLYFGVYRIKGNGNPELFGDVYELQSQEKAMISRPVRKGGVDRRLYFANHQGKLSNELFSTHDVVKNKKFIKIGNWDGDSFTITQEMLK